MVLKKNYKLEYFFDNQISIVEAFLDEEINEIEIGFIRINYNKNIIYISTLENRIFSVINEKEIIIMRPLQYDYIDNIFLYYKITYIFSKFYYIKHNINYIPYYCEINSKHMCYPKLNIHELLEINSNKNGILFYSLPLIKFINQNSINGYYKEFYLLLSEKSPSEIKEILIRIYENNDIYVSCKDFLGIDFYDFFQPSAGIIDNEINRKLYAKTCSNYRHIKSPFQTGKDIMNFLFFLAYIMNKKKLIRRDDSHISDCDAPYSVIRLSLGLDVIGMEA